MIPGRSFRLGLLTLAAGFAATALACVILWALARPGWRIRWDITPGGRAGLSPRTAAALQALPGKMKASAFLFEEYPALSQKRSGSAVYPRAFARLRSLLEAARIRSGGRLSLDIFDPNSSLPRLEEARSRLERKPGETLILERNDRRKVFRFEDLFEVFQPGSDGSPARLRGERVDQILGDAVLELSRESRPRVGVLTGYGSGSLEDPQGLKPLAELLTAEGMEPVAVEAPEKAVGLDLFLIAGQQAPFPPPAAKAIGDWLQAGSPLLLALGPGAPEAVVSAWNRRLAEKGVQFGTGVVCEPVLYAGMRRDGLSSCASLEVPFERLSGSHPVTRLLTQSQRGIFLPLVRPLRLEGGTNAWLREAIVRGGPEGWADIDGDFHRGSREKKESLNLGLAVELLAPPDGAHSGRTLILGSALALRGRSLLFVRDLVVAGLRWMLHEEARPLGLSDLQAVVYRPPEAVRVRVADLAIVGLPGATFLLGFLVWWRRRK
ncbi:MAG: Gldg family protein [Planctomycetota bacterium]